MKSSIAVCLFALLAVVVAKPNEKYTDRYDSVNLDEILSNSKILEGYIKCMLDKGKCAPDAKELKQHIKEALETECAKCTDAQKNGTRRVIGHLINHENEAWNELTAKYDSEKKFTAKYEKELREIKA